MEKIRTGIVQELTVLRKADFGVYLGFEGTEQSVLLPKKQVPEKAEIGTKIQVFIYRDSEDRLIATTREPIVQVGEFAWLTVTAVNRVGGLLYCGME